MRSTRSTQSRLASTAALFGSTIEWYDFFVYGTAAATVFGPLFFAKSDPSTGLLAAFATFAVGFAARPIGGAVFGHIGDRFGRKRALLATLTIMGAATTLIGFLPTYASIGTWAPILLVLLRLLQGISVGGEWGGAVLMAGEHAPQSRRTWHASMAQLGSPLAVLLSLGMFRFATAISGDQFMTWGWRVPFLFSIVLLVVGLIIRLRVGESPEFLEVEEKNAVIRQPVIEAFKTSYRPILMMMCAFTIGTAGFYFTNTFLISYATVTLSVPRPTVLDSLLIVGVVQFVGQLCAARIAESIGDVKLLKWAAGLGMLAPYPMFMLVGTKSMLGIVLGVSLATLCGSGFYAVIAGYASKVFGANIRYSAISASYQLGGAIFGGFTPMIGVLLSKAYPGQWVPLAMFYTILSGLSFFGVLLLARNGFGLAMSSTTTDGTVEAYLGRVAASVERAG
jgi:MFS family permease